MKLEKIVHLKESEDPASIAHWLTNNNHNKTTITATANEDGTINIAGDLEMGSAEYPSRFPAIKHAEGNYASGIASATARFPQTVSGNCKIWAKESAQVKASMVPKCTGSGTLAFGDQKGDATLELDDMSTMVTYSQVSIAITVVSGLEKVSQLKGLTALKVGDNFEGIPTHLTLKTFVVRVKDGSSLKGLGKKLKSLEANYFQINTDTPGPLMALLKPSYQFKQLVLNVQHDLYKGMEMTKFMMELKGRDLDMFDAQEVMIDAGYKEYARL